MTLITDLGHLAGGIITSLVSPVSPVISIIYGATFIVYELDEERRLKDKAYKDIAWYLTGVSVGALLVIAQSTL